MKILPVICVGLMTLTLLSCQKEIDWGTNPPAGNGTGGSGGGGSTGNPQANPSGITGGSNGTLLLRAVRKNPIDSVVATFDYNVANKFIKYTCFGREKYDTIDINYKFYTLFDRDAMNRITKFVGLNTVDTTIFGPVDSIRGFVHYPSASSTEFDWVVVRQDMGIGLFTDSSLYTYVGGKVTRKDTYTYNDLLSLVPVLSARTEFDYDASGNVKEVRSYSAGGVLGGPLSLVSKTVYTFDNKPNAYTFGNEGFLVTGIYYGPNNNLTAVNTVYGPPSQTNIVSFAYNYNAQNYPMNGQMAANNPNRTFTMTYYYK